MAAKKKKVSKKQMSFDFDDVDSGAALAGEDEPVFAEEPKKVAVVKRRGKRRAMAETAETMAAKQRDISISEFFAKNRHLLGFDNPRKALLTAVKEAVDNSLDACEDAHILPDIVVTIMPVKDTDNRFVLNVTDNGPGIVKAQVPNIFARLLYGSKFHTLKMSRGPCGRRTAATSLSS